MQLRKTCLVLNSCCKLHRQNKSDFFCSESRISEMSASKFSKTLEKWRNYVIGLAVFFYGERCGNCMEIVSRLIFFIDTLW